MFPALKDCLWDILESEACEKFFINDAEKPAFFILSKYNPLSHGNFELYMSNVAKLGDFKTQKEAREKLKTVIATAKHPIRVYTFTKRRRPKLFEKIVGER